MVLDGVVRAAFQNFCDLGPLVFKFPVKQEKYPLFNFGPLAPLISWIEMVVPPLSAVLTLSVW